MLEQDNPPKPHPLIGFLMPMKQISWPIFDASQTVPVIVDFRPGGPCRTLGPQLEEAVIAAKGAVKMAKVNVDENQMIAGQMRVQTIPTVYAFWQGKPIDAFKGQYQPPKWRLL